MELISFVLYILDNQQMSQYNDVIVYVVINFVQILFHIWAKTLKELCHLPGWLLSFNYS